MFMQVFFHYSICLLTIFFICYSSVLREIWNPEEPEEPENTDPVNGHPSGRAEEPEEPEEAAEAECVLCSASTDSLGRSGTQATSGRKCALWISLFALVRF